MVLVFSLHSAGQKHYAQVYEPGPFTEKAAKVVHKKKMPYEAFRIVNGVLRRNAADPELQYIYAASLIQTNGGDKAKALKPLLYYKENKADPPYELDYFMGVAYQHNLQFDKAIQHFEAYKKRCPYPGHFKDYDMRILQCRNAPQFLKNRVNVSFENAGKHVNSAGEEYHPVVVPDEKAIYFSTRRDGTTGGLYALDGSFTPDIYWSFYKYGKHKPAKSIGKPNSLAIEEIAGMSEYGDYILYHIENENALSDLFYAKKKKGSYDRPVAFTGEMVQAQKETDATMSNDGKYIIMASDRHGGNGGFDLWIVRKLDNGNWAQPQNISELNTQGDERNPQLMDEGNTLYFSSQGHTSIGGFDLFMSKRNSKTGNWGPPINLGYPLNTIDDNMSISFTQNRRHAYVSQWREDSYGGLDIYRVSFNDLEPNYTVFKTVILSKDSTPWKVKAKFEVLDPSDKVIGTYHSDAETGKFLMILPPGDYKIRNQGAVFKQRSYPIKALDKAAYRSPVELKITLDQVTKQE